MLSLLFVKAVLPFRNKILSSLRAATKAACPHVGVSVRENSGAGQFGLCHADLLSRDNVVI